MNTNLKFQNIFMFFCAVILIIFWTNQYRLLHLCEPINVVNDILFGFGLSLIIHFGLLLAVFTIGRKYKYLTAFLFIPSFLLNIIFSPSIWLILLFGIGVHLFALFIIFKKAVLPNA